ncbi:PLP-dependent aminotransferase family protein [Thalassotalea euphylliae]|uniref:aminotransferase-like domain-containing protein n=1 Tax=Thalassotalea euphylliae TaxID=1655234 RepID=UPI0036270AD6
MRQFKYQQLAQLFRDNIEQGIWLPHEKLPSIRALAAKYSLSKISVQHALQSLESKQLIVAKPKSGYYVLPKQVASNNDNQRYSIASPKQVTMPEIFYRIMEQGAAFDIAPNASDQDETSQHIATLQRHLGRALRQSSYKKAMYYAPPAGSDALREQIVLHYQRRGLFVSADDICISAGCQNSLYLTLQSLCQPGDIVAVESPAFYGVLQLLQHLHLKIIEIPSSYTQGIDVDQLEQAAQKWPIKACIVTPNFATPTGAQMPQSHMKALLQVAEQHNFLLLEDDIYGDLGFQQLTSPLKAFDQHEQVILCSSFSKALSRDLRIGWTINRKYAKQIAQTKLVNQLSTSQATQDGLTSFLQEGHFERHLYQRRRQLLKQRDQLLATIKQYWRFEVRYTVPDGGIALWLTLPAIIDTLALYKEALEQSILLTPGQLFSTEQTFSQNLRLSFAHPMNKERLAAFKTLGKLIKAKL